MSFSELIVLLPCHSLEDFPLYFEGDAAAGLLAAWTGPWHPRLIAAAGKAPTWQRADTPPAETAGRLFVVPPVAVDRLPPDFVARARQEGGRVICDAVMREAVVAAALAGCSGADVSAELVADFHALGYCLLQVELLTRQMRYASNLDEAALGQVVLSAAELAVRGDEAAARQSLQGAFNLLAAARQYFYPVDSYLVDLTLVAEATLGAALAAELEQPTAVNLLLPADLLDRLATEHPNSLQAVCAALDERDRALVGGGHEGPLPLWPLETVLADLEGSGEQYQQLLGRRPQVFGRRLYGLSPGLPLLLGRLGYRGALHFTLDDGRFPLGRRARCAGRLAGNRSTPWPGCPATPPAARRFWNSPSGWARRWIRTTWPRSCLPIGPAERAPGMPICAGPAAGRMRGAICDAGRVLQRYLRAQSHRAVRAR